MTVHTHTIIRQITPEGRIVLFTDEDGITQLDDRYESRAVALQRLEEYVNDLKSKVYLHLVLLEEVVTE